MIYMWASAIIVVIYAFMYYMDPKRKIDKMFPGPFRLPVLGNALLGLYSAEGFYQIALKYTKFYDYKTFRVWLLHKPYILVTDYKVAKMILSNPSYIDKPVEYKYFEPWLGNAIFTSTGEKWKKSRKLITPAFHFKILHQFFKVFDKNAQVLCKKLEKHDGRNSFDIYEYVALCALDNVCETAMGVHVQAQNYPNSSYVKAVKRMITVIYKRCLMVWLRSDTIFNMSKTGRIQKSSLEVLHNYTNGVIQERKRQLQHSKAPAIEAPEKVEKQQMAFLDTLLENGQALGFTDEEIRQEVDTVMFAAHDTVSSSLGFILYSLAEHQDVQEKVYKELETIFQESDRCPTFDDLEEMKYMKQVIKESLRLYTVVPIIARKLNEDLRINEEQYIPKNMDVVLVFAAIHRDPKIWADPNKFDPERFSPEAIQNKDSFTFLPFSAGCRNCLGQKFAMFEMKITLCKILRQFKLSLSNDIRDKIKPRASLVLVSGNGIRIKVESRKHTTINMENGLTNI